MPSFQDTLGQRQELRGFLCRASGPQELRAKRPGEFCSRDQRRPDWEEGRQTGGDWNCLWGTGEAEIHMDKSPGKKMMRGSEGGHSQEGGLGPHPRSQHGSPITLAAAQRGHALATPTCYQVYGEQHMTLVLLAVDTASFSSRDAGLGLS